MAKKEKEVVPEKKEKKPRETKSVEKLYALEGEEARKIADLMEAKPNQVISETPDEEISSEEIHEAEAKEEIKEEIKEEELEVQQPSIENENAKEEASKPFVQNVPSIEEAIERIEGKKKVVVETKEENKTLSEGALKWAKYLKMQNQTPEQFLNHQLNKFHPHRSLVQELFDYEKKLEKK